MPAAHTQNLTILLTDIKGFTEKTSHKTRADILRMLEKHKEIVMPVLKSRGGRLVKTIGDAFLVVFASPTDGVLAGVAVQEALAAFNKDKGGDERIDVRIAINAGEVSIVDNDIFGEPVNIVSRIEGIAEAGEVFFTEAVYLAMNKQEVSSSEVGDRQLKGIAQKVKVYKVLSPTVLTEKDLAAKARLRAFSWAALSVFLLLLAGWIVSASRSGSLQSLPEITRSEASHPAPPTPAFPTPAFPTPASPTPALPAKPARTRSRSRVQHPPRRPGRQSAEPTRIADNLSVEQPDLVKMSPGELEAWLNRGKANRKAKVGMAGSIEEILSAIQTCVDAGTPPEGPCPPLDERLRAFGEEHNEHGAKPLVDYCGRHFPQDRCLTLLQWLDKRKGAW